MGEQAGPAGREWAGHGPLGKGKGGLASGGLGGKLHCWEPQASSWNELPSLDSAFPNLTLLGPVCFGQVRRLQEPCSAQDGVL